MLAALILQSVVAAMWCWNGRTCTHYSSHVGAVGSTKLGEHQKRSKPLLVARGTLKRSQRCTKLRRHCRCLASVTHVGRYQVQGGWRLSLCLAALYVLVAPGPAKCGT